MATNNSNQDVSKADLMKTKFFSPRFFLGAVLTIILGFIFLLWLFFKEADFVSWNPWIWIPMSIIACVLIYKLFEGKTKKMFDWFNPVSVAGCLLAAFALWSFIDYKKSPKLPTEDEKKVVIDEIVVEDLRRNHNGQHRFIKGVRYAFYRERQPDEFTVTEQVSLRQNPYLSGKLLIAPPLNEPGYEGIILNFYRGKERGVAWQTTFIRGGPDMNVSDAYYDEESGYWVKIINKFDPEIADDYTVGLGCEECDSFVGKVEIRQ